ncbi:DUF4434 domain-containing protein [Paenibacillus chungangensis]|uniref:DUF4434 domain-containing protein n=1 Tax=Paenibacillus chungangensis TaxID=696535 RepID=A0ABW3HPF8_9BACL
MKAIRGSLYYMNLNGGKTSIDREITAQAKAGFDLLWVNGPAFSLESLQMLGEQGQFDPIAYMLDEAHAMGMKVIIEVMADSNWYMRWDLEADLERSDRIVSILAQRYGIHPAFEGYYLGNELYIVHGKDKEYIRTLWASIAAQCRSSTPGCKIVASPFFVSDSHEVLGYPYECPEAYEQFWDEMLTGCDLDIVMLQDSGAEHGAFYSVEEREPYFAAVASACNRHGVELWGNIELAEIDVKDYIELKQFRGEHGANGEGFHDRRWKRVPLPKLNKKSELASKYCRHLVSWGFQQFISPESGMPGCQSYYEAFCRWNLDRREKAVQHES